MNCRVLAKKRQSSKLLCTCPKERFSQNCWGEQVYFWSFPIFSKKILEFSRKMLEQLSNIPSTCPTKNSEGTKIGGKSIWHRFRTLGTTFWNFGRKFSADISELSFTYPNDEFQGKLFKQIYVSSFFTDFKRKWSGLLWNTLRKIVKTQSHVSKSFFGEIWIPKYRSISFFVVCEQKFSGLSAKTFWLEWITAFDV